MSGHAARGRAGAIGGAIGLYVLTDPKGPRGWAPYLEALASFTESDAGDTGWALCLRDHEADDADTRDALRLLLAASAGRTPVLCAAATLARAALALEEGAGVHLPERGPDARAVRALREDALVIASVHDEAGMARRCAQGVDLAVLAPFAAVPDKGPPLSDEAVRAVTRHPRPVLALGGIRDAHDVTRAVALGCVGVAIRAPLAFARDGAEARTRFGRWVWDARIAARG